MMAYTRQLSPYGSRSFAGRDFVIYMFQEDVNEMGRWVLKHPHNETGGDLFGLWTAADHGNKLEPVIHIVLGPGSGCRRTSTSFFQSIPYLKKVGYLLTQKYMLGHIGEWHSHHQLGLFEPSGGDSNTVITNFPRGACGFILIIVNILSHKEVKISPYLYSENSRHYQSGRVEILRGKSPFRKTSDIPRAISEGAEFDVEATRYNDQEIAMDIDYSTEHRPSRSSKRQPVKMIGRNDRQGRSTRELSPVQYPSSARASMDSQMRSQKHQDPDEFTNIRKRSPVVPMASRSPSPTRRTTSRKTDTDKLTTSHEERATVPPRGIEAAEDDRNPLPSVDTTSSPMVSAASTEHTAGSETREPSSDAPPDDATYPPEGDESSSRAGETERDSPGSADESPGFTTSHRQDPSTVTLHLYSPLPGTAVGDPLARFVTKKQTLPPISHESSWFKTSDQERRATTPAPATGHPSRRRSTTSEKLTDVRQCTRREQWYTTQEGQDRLKEIRDGLENEKKLIIDRQKETEDLSISFKCHQQKWVIEFARDFPQSDITLKGPHFEEEINRETFSMTALTKKILLKVRNHCNCCSKRRPPRSPKSGVSARSINLPRKTSGNIRPGSNAGKSKTEPLNPRWRY